MKQKITLQDIANVYSHLSAEKKGAGYRGTVWAVVLNKTQLGDKHLVDRMDGKIIAGKVCDLLGYPPLKTTEINRLEGTLEF